MYYADAEKQIKVQQRQSFIDVTISSKLLWAWSLLARKFDKGSS